MRSRVNRIRNAIDRRLNEPILKNKFKKNIIKSFYVFFLFLTTSENNFYLFSKIVIYLSLFLKIILK